MPDRKEQAGIGADRAVAVAQDIATLSYRQAATKYNVGYKTWRAIKSGDTSAYLPRQKGDRVSPEAVESILASVKSMPQLNTQARAKALGYRVDRVQRVLAAARLSRLAARLQFAGYSVAPSQSLALARQRRIVAAAPGCYTCCDFKYFGRLRGVGQSPSVRIFGLVVIDQLTGYGDVLICPTETSDMAVAGIRRYIARAPFAISGLLLTDNGAQFTSDEFIQAATDKKLIIRTTRYHHPWSNGKVERFNGTLAHECFPAILTGIVADLFELQKLVDVWLEYYNTKRAYTGWLNRGLPPVVLAKQFAAAQGDDPLERLVSVGILRQADIEFIRPLGANVLGRAQRDYKGRTYSDDHCPYAFVVDRKAQQEARELREATRLATEQAMTISQVSNVELAMKGGTRKDFDLRALPLRRRLPPAQSKPGKH